jgi:hypothetical protein
MDINFMKWLKNIPSFSIARPFQKYTPKWYFWYANIPSGNPGLENQARTSSYLYSLLKSAAARYGEGDRSNLFSAL